MVQRTTGERSVWRSTAASVALTLLIAVADFDVGPEVHLAVVYLIPIFIATWNAGRGTGIAIAAASAVLSSGGDVLAAPRGAWLVPLIMTVLWGAMFLVFVLMLTELKRALQRERALAREDFLTGVANRRHFLELTVAEINRARRYRRPLTVAYLDLDNFKDVNDRLGHDAGDELLKTVATALRARLRVTDAIGRIGGDEFAVCLPETDQEAAQRVLEDMRREVADALPERCRDVTLSVGIVTFAVPPEDVEVLLREADRMLYEAKNAGKNVLRTQVVESAT